MASPHVYHGAAYNNNNNNNCITVMVFREYLNFAALL